MLSLGGLPHASGSVEAFRPTPSLILPFQITVFRQVVHQGSLAVPFLHNVVSFPLSVSLSLLLFLVDFQALATLRLQAARDVNLANRLNTMLDICLEIRLEIHLEVLLIIHFANRLAIKVVAIMFNHLSTRLEIRGLFSQLAWAEE
jgi:hypothetical protein